MKKPKKLKIGGYEYVIKWSEKAWSALVLEEDGVGTLVGRTSHHKTTIYLNPHVSEQSRRDTLMHEILHTIYGVCSGMKFDDLSMLSDKEEYLVGMTTPWLLTVLRENPKVLAYLLAPHEG